MGVNLSDSLQCSNFLTKLVALERVKHLLSDWEQDFIEQMRTNFEERDSQLDLGITPWTPSAKQWNTLSELARTY